MIKNTTIKAMNEEEAKKRALNILEAKEYQIIEVKVLENPKSFLGLFSKNGVFEIFVDLNKTNEEVKQEKIEPKRVEKKDITVEREKKQEKQKNREENDMIQKIEKFIDLLGLSLKVNIQKISEKHYQIELLGEDNGIIIGKKGKTLNSLEYLLNSMYKEVKIEIDVEGFKEKRNNTLQELAKKMAEKCIRTRKTIRLNAMPPKERKIIHEILNTYSELETYSEGRDPKRYIVIKYKKR